MILLIFLLTILNHRFPPDNFLWVFLIVAIFSSIVAFIPWIGAFYYLFKPKFLNERGPNVSEDFSYLTLFEAVLLLILIPLVGITLPALLVSYYLPFNRGEEAVIQEKKAREAQERYVVDASKITPIKELIYQLERQHKDGVRVENAIESAAEQELSAEDVLQVIKILKGAGVLYEPKKGWIKKK
jgi:formate hydrogenlyase subunit 3/multisubunit Na+/H+ antiporter MnhD subunit